MKRVSMIRFAGGMAAATVAALSAYLLVTRPWRKKRPEKTAEKPVEQEEVPYWTRAA